MTRFIGDVHMWQTLILRADEFLWFQFDLNDCKQVISVNISSIVTTIKEDTTEIGLPSGDEVQLVLIARSWVSPYLMAWLCLKK